MMIQSLRLKVLVVAAIAALAFGTSASAREFARELRRDLATAAFGHEGGQQPPAPQQQPQTSVGVVLTGEGGAQVRLAVPDLLALSPDRETQDAAKVIGEVLWDDLNYEREFYMIPRDTYKSIPPAPTVDNVPYDRWRELGADFVVSGT